MIYLERLLKIIKFPYISEKTSNNLDKYNIFSLKVVKYATKTDIKKAVSMLFNVQVKKVSTLIVARKIKGSKDKIRCRSDWKKVYVVLKDGYKIDLTDKIR